MTNQPNMLTHRCGQCNQIFKLETEYLKHKCTTLGEPKEKEGPSSFFKSEPPQIAKEQNFKKITEDEILKAVIEARKKKSI